MELELSAGVLDRQIDNLKAEIADEYFDDEKLELLIEYAMKLGEVYAQRDLLEKAKAQAVPEGYVLMPLEPTQEMLGAANLAPMPMVHVDSISGREKLRISTQYKAMVNVCKSGAEG
ncbi:TPA: hypothetical protein RP350_003193 [Acinetobacter baumannii]|nr:hypothetical protein [Acinetobacter baumannii]PQL70096.1 hypothetical protein CV956_005905 [Acinetobacter baumannii]PQL88158.1 hypothetical protein CV955_0006665 [Acinetobacter baumannii]HDX5875984.1 hypothetical protein [Acinetobacter baumannii]